jgi:hypothetical protein
MPEGVSYEGIFEGDEKQFNRLTMYARLGSSRRATGTHNAMVTQMAPMAGMAPASIASGSGGGTGGGVYNGVPAPPAPPPSKQELAKANKNSLDENVGYIITDEERSAFHGATTGKLAESSPSRDAKPASDRALLASKLSPAVLARFDCWKNQAKDCKLAPDGTIEIQLFLTKDPAAVLEQLKAAGLEVSQLQSKDKAVTGRVPLEKLIAVANLDTVRFVAPLRR